MEHLIKWRTRIVDALSIATGLTLLMLMALAVGIGMAQLAEWLLR